MDFPHDIFSGSDDIPGTCLYLFEGDRGIPLSGNMNFNYGELFESLGDQVRRHPLHPGQIHLWELEIPEELRGREGFRDGSVDEVKCYPSRNPARVFPKETLHSIRIHILASYLSCNPGEVRLSRGQYGQPIVDTPSCPYAISTSYTDERWMLAVSHGHLVGTDIEHIKSTPALIAIAHRFFHPEEWNHISSLPPAGQIRSFFELWTLKEAYLKVIEKGWSGVESLPDMTHCLSRNPTGRNWTFKRVGEYRTFLMTSSIMYRALVSCTHP